MKTDIEYLTAAKEEIASKYGWSANDLPKGNWGFVENELNDKSALLAIDKYRCDFMEELKANTDDDKLKYPLAELIEKIGELRRSSSPAYGVVFILVENEARKLLPKEKEMFIYIRNLYKTEKAACSSYHRALDIKVRAIAKFKKALKGKKVTFKDAMKMFYKL